MSQLVRFLAVGGGLAAGYALATAALVSAGAPKVATSVALYLLCIPLGFVLQGRLTFRVPKARRGALALYAATQALSLGIVTLATALFVTGDFRRDTIVLLAASGSAALVSFAVSRAVVFRP